MNKVCDDCGSTEGRIIRSSKYNKNLCNKCYQLYRINGGAIVYHELPGPGEIKYDKEGKPICHICGRAVKKLMSHATLKHGMTAYEYKKAFGLNTTKSVMAESSIEVARQRNLENRDITVTNLLQGGKATRFKKGCEGRTKDKVSLQTLKELKKFGIRTGKRKIQM